LTELLLPLVKFPKGATSFFGSIGHDNFGEQLKQCAAADGVHAYYKEDPNTPTGTVALLKNGYSPLHGLTVWLLIVIQALVRCWYTGVSALWWRI